MVYETSVIGLFRKQLCPPPHILKIATSVFLDRTRTLILFESLRLDDIFTFFFLNNFLNAYFQNDFGVEKVGSYVDDFQAHMHVFVKC